jgi:CRISPR-associated protein Cas2
VFVLVTYDVSTETKAGRKRLRRVAKICEDYGQLVQRSVFECSLDPALWIKFRAMLTAEINGAEDSLRFYLLGANWERRVEHIGTPTRPIIPTVL